MGSDRARNTYDARQRYRSVVAQQGRVVIEADLNEAQEIAAEELRAEALDFVGPQGTPGPPDEGYAVSFDVPPSPHPRNFKVNPGTMYVGGVRVTRPNAPLPFDLTYWGQKNTEWVDGPETPDLETERELICLHLREQEVSAVEDEALREVALGGPDTAQRTRLTQHIVRLAVDETTIDCAGALTQARRQWLEQGLRFDPDTRRLMPTAQLRVEFVPPASANSLCDPAAQAGYLGAENQLIRVQVSATKPGSPQKLLWSYDNGAHLYRVDLVDKGRKVTLRTSPADAFHFPREGQVVEVLRAAVQLGNGQYTAAPTGLLFTLGSEPYEPNERLLTLSTEELPPEYLDENSTPALFVRIWEEELEPGSATTPSSLGQTGLRVHLAGGTLVPGDYWMVAVRPSTPQQLYPARYLAGPQFPDGPRQWVCPLALVGWNKGGGTVLDCRPPFDNLVELTARVNKLVGGGCCTVTVTPADLAQRPLQEIIDTLVKERGGNTHLTVCLRPGLYTLQEPLRLDERHGGLTIEGCRGAVLAREASREDSFLDGLIVLEQVSGVTLRDLELRLLPVRFISAKGASLASLSFSELEGRTNTQLIDFLESLTVGVGIRLVRVSRITIEGCRFDASVFTEDPSFVAGIFANDTCLGLEVRNNHFLAADTRRAPDQEWKHMAFGYLHTPSTTFRALSPPTTPLSREERANGGLAPPRLDEATFRGNQFSNLSAAIFLQADPGTVRLEGNQVRSGYAGFWLMTPRASAHAGVTEAGEVLGERRSVDELRRLLEGFGVQQFIDNEGFRELYDMGLALLTDPLLLVASTLARGYPLPSRSRDLLREVVGAPAGPGFIIDSVRNLAFLAAQGVSWIPQMPRLVFTPHDQYKDLDILFGPLHRVLAAIEQHPSPDRPSQASCHVSGNDIETGNDNAPLSTAALTLWDAETPPRAGLPPPAPAVWSLLLSTNRLRARTPLQPAARILNVEQSTVTGNICQNQPPPAGTSLPAPWSFILVPPPERDRIATTAITGNVCIGPAVLPRRQDFPNLPWAQLNTLRPS